MKAVWLFVCVLMFGYGVAGAFETHDAVNAIKVAQTCHQQSLDAAVDGVNPPACQRTLASR